MNKVIALILFGILFSSTLFAFEPIAEFSEETLPVLNEDLRKTFNNLPEQQNDFDMGTHKIKNVTDPSVAQDAATKNYVDSIVSSGMIVMWSGSIATIPTGWVLCDGDNSTPDLRNRFIIAADADDGGVAKTTITGAATQSGNSNIASHTHGLKMYNGSGTTTNPVGNAHCHAAGDNNYRAIAPDSTLRSGSITSTGTGSETYPKYFALAYIMKT